MRENEVLGEPFRARETARNQRYWEIICGPAPGPRLAKQEAQANRIRSFTSRPVVTVHFGVTALAAVLNQSINQSLLLTLILVSLCLQWLILGPF